MSVPALKSNAPLLGQRRSDAELSSDTPDASSHEEGEYSPFVAFCVTTNYILGVGIVGIPKVFVTGGWLLSTAVMFIVSIIAICTALWYVEAGHRANRKLLAIHQANHAFSSSDSASDNESQSNEAHVNLDAESIAVVDDSDNQSMIPSLEPRRIEVNELIGLYVSQKMRMLYEFLLSVYMIGSLWSYTSVFATAMAAFVPVIFINDGDTCFIGNSYDSCYLLYLFWCGVFACVVIPLACRKLSEMKIFVVCLAAVRFIAIAAMIITTVDMIYREPAVDTNGKSQSDALSPPFYSRVPAARWEGLGVIFPVCIFAQIFHHSVPGIAFPMKDKRAAPVVFTACLFTMFCLYSSLGVTLAIYFGEAIKSQCTLNWAEYWNVFLKFLIVLFPAADVLSAFPLKAITVGNNVVRSFVKLPADAPVPLRKSLPFRAIAAIVPIIGACVVNDLTVLLTYTGSLGIFIAFLFPAWVQLRSRNEDQEKSGVLSDRVDKIINHRITACLVILFSVAALTTVIVTIAIGAGGH